MLAEYLLLPLLASYASAVQISVAKSGGNVTTGLQYGAMEEVCPGIISIMRE
jgi:alpha-N-arabinofuranosidase